MEILGHSRSLKLTVLVLCLMLASCGSKSEHFISPEIADHVRLFESMYGIKVDFDVVMSNLDKSYVGMCTEWSDGSKKIEISAYYASIMPTELIEETVLHELGHCVLGRDHDDKFIRRSGSWIPKSIMYSYVHPSSSLYNLNKEWYYSELINP